MKLSGTTPAFIAHPCIICEETFLGWSAIHLGNAIVDVYVVPDIGGRIIQLRLGGQDYLYINAAHSGTIYPPNENTFAEGWKNYGGSKVWPAPQGWSSDFEWPGPPDPVLDGGRYAWEILDSGPETAALGLESPPDEYTGITLSREIRIFKDSSTIKIHHRMRNTSCRRVRWAIWQVSQLQATPGFCLFTLARNYRQLLGDQDYPGIEMDPQTGLWKLRFADSVAKFAVQPREGWFGSLDASRNLVLIESFPIFEGAQYPNGAASEFWVSGSGYFNIHGDKISNHDGHTGPGKYVETEILSPMVSLDCGEEYSFEVAWHCTCINSNRIISATHCSAAGRNLIAERYGARCHLTGAFGVFHAATLDAVSYRRDGQPMGAVPLGLINPRKPCDIDCDIPCNEDVARVSLQLRNASGRLLGTVGGALIS